MRSTTTAAPTRHQSRLGSTSTRVFRRPEAGAAVGVAVVFLIFSIFGGTGGFLSPHGTAGWLAVAAELGIVSLAVGLLMIAGEFDLSIGSVLASSSMVVAVSVSTFHLPPIVGVAFALAFGVGIGLLNGLLVVRTGLPSFIVTLVTLFALAGAALGISREITGTTSVSMRSEGVLHNVLAGRWEQFNVSILWWIAATAVAFWVLQRSRFGNWIFATGGDVETARQTGVPVARVKIRLYMYSGFSAAFLGVIQVFEFGTADVTRGQNFVFQAIVASVVGGCLLSGGYGSVIGVVLGASTYAIVSVGIYYTGWNPDLVQLFVGVLLLLAVLGNNFVRRLALSRA